MDDQRETLDRLGLLDSDSAIEAARNVMVEPSADSATRALAASLTRAIVADRRLAALPAKFGWLVDGGGPLSIIGERADVAMHSTTDGVALRLRDQWLGLASPDQAVKAADRVGHGRATVVVGDEGGPEGGCTSTRVRR